MNSIYDEITRPYNHRLERSGDNDNIGRGSHGDAGGAGGADGGGDENSLDGNEFGDIWVENWIKSRSWQPKEQGFYLDAKRGYIEGMHFAVGSGIEMYGNDMFFYDSTKGVNMSIVSAGSGYLPGDHVHIPGGDGNASIIIDKVNYPGGQVQSFILYSGGTGYDLANNVSTSGGSGSGLRLNILSVSQVGTIQVFEGDKATINFQRKYFPEQNFIMQKRVGINSPAEDRSDCIFEMFYQSPPQSGRKNKVLIGTGGEAPTDTSEFTNELHLYATDYIQIGTRTQKSRGISEFMIENKARNSDMNADGSRFILTYNQTNPVNYMLFNPDTGKRYDWKGGGMLFNSFSSVNDIFPENMRPAFGFDLGAPDGSGRIWNYSISNAGSGYQVGNVVSVGGGSGATIRVLGVTSPDSPVPGEVIDCKLLTHGSGYAIMNNVSTSGGSGSGFRINILDNQQRGNTWIFSTLLPNVCDELIGVPAPSLGSAVYMFKDIYAHRHYFSTTHYLQYHPDKAVFEFAPGGSVYTHGSVYAEGNVVAQYLEVDENGKYIIGDDEGIDMEEGTPHKMEVRGGIVIKAEKVDPVANGTFNTGYNGWIKVVDGIITEAQSASTPPCGYSCPSGD